MTTYKNLPNETDREREQRMIAEFDAYAVQCAADGVESTNFMNWLASRKFSELIAEGKRPTERRERHMTDDEVDMANIIERRGERKKEREKKVKNVRI